jgi:hypothetical protein
MDSVYLSLQYCVYLVLLSLFEDAHAEEGFRMNVKFLNASRSWTLFAEECVRRDQYPYPS